MNAKGLLTNLGGVVVSAELWLDFVKRFHRWHSSGVGRPSSVTRHAKERGRSGILNVGLSQSVLALTVRRIAFGAEERVLEDANCDVGHPNAQEEAIASEAAGRQGTFDEMVDALFDNQTEWSGVADPTSLFEGHAVSLGLNASQFSSEMADTTLADESLGILTTPVLSESWANYKCRQFECTRHALRRRSERSVGRS